VSGLRRRYEGRPLSSPEVEVLSAAAEGLSADETAARLVKSPHTVVRQRRVIEAKRGARNLVHAVALAYERHLLPTRSLRDQVG
jgi:DNA-binding CsgD family transcriptional regulator